MAKPAHEFPDGFTIEAHAPHETRHDHGVVGDDAEGDGLRQASRATHRKDGIADADTVRVRKLCDGQGGLGTAAAEVQLDDSDISHGVSTDQRGRQFFAISQSADERGPAASDVIIGHHVALGVDDGPRADGMLAEHAAVSAVLGNHLNPDNRGRHLGDSPLDFGSTALGFIRTSQ